MKWALIAYLAYELAGLVAVLIAGPALLHVTRLAFVGDMALGAVPFLTGWWMWRRCVQKTMRRESQIS